jgi:RNA polymerase sigma-70 factor (ECF subfamily)
VWLPGLTALQSDDDIIRAIKQGDQDALGKLYTRYTLALWRFVWVRLRSHHASEDVVSEAWLAAIRGIHRYDPNRVPVYYWLVGIAKNKILDFLHKQRRGQIALSGLAEATNDVSHPDAERIRKVLIEMDDDGYMLECLVLQWKYLDGLKVCDIAQRLEKSESAIQNLLYRARMEFHRRYGQEYQSELP